MTDEPKTHTIKVTVEIPDDRDVTIEIHVPAKVPKDSIETPHDGPIAVLDRRE